MKKREHLSLQSEKVSQNFSVLIEQITFHLPFTAIRGGKSKSKCFNWTDNISSAFCMYLCMYKL